MFVAFSGLALVLAAIGWYSVIAFDVAQRSHELGVRIALGAQVGDVLRLVIGAGLRFGVAGVVAGLAITLVAGRFVAPLLFDVSPRDPVILAVVGAVLLGVAVMATYLTKSNYGILLILALGLTKLIESSSGIVHASARARVSDPVLPREKSRRNRAAGRARTTSWRREAASRASV